MVISDSAVIVIVLVASLFLTALCAALFRHYNPTGDDCKAYERNLEQSKYMRAVRLRNYGFLKRESMSAAKDLESRCMLRSHSL
ncbi:hypothetical protein N7468_006743 [Penicillium chermesinum]|uniref:Uncharacterized protein n=1 Tax=Penicillium chermesinum TaxID=63820 RepID=A0A9W9NV82_9EURO|nr:uncharacterized protein N7468_006743 [Penicillium chermesinum]KAJ5225518.1 hypothetical protein N7468_006743 [Penicillium chermesinum]